MPDPTPEQLQAAFDQVVKTYSHREDVAGVDVGFRYDKGKRTKRFSVRVNHLASASFVYAPGKGLGGKKWKLALRIAGPAKSTSPAAVVVVPVTDGGPVEGAWQLWRSIRCRSTGRGSRGSSWIAT